MSDNSLNFAQLNLKETLLKALHELNFHTPSPIQEQTIPWMLQKRDIIALAQTGTGKTAAFALPILQNLNLDQREPQALILAPTRELAIQVAEHFEALAKYQRGIQVAVLCGGQDYRTQLKKLRDGAHVVVGTPGRILDHIERSTLKLNAVRTFVLDEGDEMLRMGFIEDVETVLSKLPEERQIALFSATMPSRIRQTATRYLNEPVSVEIKSETATVKTIEQRFIFAAQQQKPDSLLRVLAVEDYQGVIVFVRTKNSTEEVAEHLISQGYRAMAIHGDISQALRERIISQFRQGAIDILVATDVAARGLDVERVTHVVNYDMVQDCETYVHRIGRTGRAGRSGVTILFVTPREARMLNNIERHTRQRIEKMQVPHDHMIQQVTQQRFMKKITERLQHENVISYQTMIKTYLKDHPETSVDDIACALALLCNQDKPWHQIVSLPQSHRTSREPAASEHFESKRSRFTESSGKRPPQGRQKYQSDNDYPQEVYRLNVGRIHGVKPGNIVGAIANEAGLQSRYITGLKIHDDHSTVRLPRGIAKEIMQHLNKAWVCGRQLKLESLGAA